MKWLILVLLTSVQANALTLTWNANTDPGTVGYKIYYGGVTQTYTNVADVGLVRMNFIPGLLTNVPYFFAVTAYNAAGLESDFSAELAYTITNAPPPPDTNQVWLVQSWTATNVLGPWSNLVTMRLTNTDLVRFFKTTATNETPRAPTALRVIAASPARRGVITTATLPPLPPVMTATNRTALPALPPRWITPKRKR